MKKLTVHTEAAYLIGVFLTAVGSAFAAKANFGLSMVIAPAYLIHLKLSAILPFYTFGMSGYVLEAFLLILLVLYLRKFRLRFLFSFVTAVLFGVMLDLVSPLLVPLGTAIPLRLVWFVIGVLTTTAGIGFLFKTYLSPEVYELIVLELAKKFKLENHKMKWYYDITSCIISIIMSFLFFGFGRFVGVNWGTAVCAVANGIVIGRWSKLYERIFEFRDGIPALRNFFDRLS